MLTLSHIRKDYGKFTAVEDINLELENGLYAMLAPNGAGKTTLIKMITTLLYPTSGEILYNGMDIYKMGETSFVWLGGIMLWLWYWFGVHRTEKYSWAIL